MAPKFGKKFCVEHGGVEKEETEEESERIPCPYDSKHSCYLRKLRKHLKKCNSRPKDLPSYIAPQVNLMDSECSAAEDIRYSITTLPDDSLLDLIRKIESLYAEGKFECWKSILEHECMISAVNNSELGMNTKKHLIQNSSLIKNMEENNFLRENVTFVEFGAGRAQLGFWIAQAIKDKEKCSLILIDKASQRHKSDNKLKGASPVKTMRIRADIADLALGKIPLLTESKNEVVGVTKHLCGIATDLALRCIVNGKLEGLNVSGILMAFCCHHRCTWTSYAGKEFLLNVGFTPYEFSALCSISSWATCGSGKPRSKWTEESTEETEGSMEIDRYRRHGLSQEIREEIGRKCKMILNYGRLKYLEKHGYEAKLIYYVEQNVSPENVCIIAKLKNSNR